MTEALERKLQNGPFYRYSELINDAQVACRQLGLQRSAVLSAASAGEVLLDETLRCVLWEDGKTPEEAGKIFADKHDFKPRTTSLLPGYLAGTWDAKGDGVIAQWFQNVYSLRHRVVHSGENPTAEETAIAVENSLELCEFLADRLADKVHRFPRTAMFLLGEPGLEKRGLWNDDLKALSSSPTEPPWISTFVRWREATEAVRACKKFHKNLEGEAGKASAIFWVLPNGSHRWVLHDPASIAAADVRVEMLDGLTPEELAETEALIRQARSGELPEPLMRVFAHTRPKTDITVDWVLPYRLLPMMNVMVDGSDQI